MPNHLANETSPYLLQHALNPVDWFAWGPEALQKARDENKPIFLSIGYAACHWCHVMAHESFEDPEVAAYLNDHFVSIKVDREERPDLDSIYMNAVVAMTGQGGWPMSVFLTPEGEPFYGGTYFPPERRHGMPSFKEVLSAIVAAWEKDQDEVRSSGEHVARQLAQSAIPAAGAGETLGPPVLERAARTLLNSYDWKQGGWGQAPRFPQPMAIDFLLMLATREDFDLKEECLQAARHALDKMSLGGMHDEVGGGFHRYSTDDAWLVPHFEKMLYDNAQLALSYLHAHVMTGSLAFRQVCTGTLDFILNELADPSGGFYSSLDADSEGEEGKYYLWTPEAVDQALADEADRALFYKIYPFRPGGNFEGHTILQRRASYSELARDLGMIEADVIDNLARLHQQLNAFRLKRVHPAIDDKVLTGWNALALIAFAEAARYLHRNEYLEAAQNNARFLLSQMKVDGALARSWRGGQARQPAFLEDYAALILGLLALYQTDLDPQWHAAALRLGEEMVLEFSDPAGGFFDTPKAAETPVYRPKDVQDNAIPSGNALAAQALLRLSAFDERESWGMTAERMLAGMQAAATQYPTSFAFWLQAMDFAVGPVRQIAVIGYERSLKVEEFFDYLWSRYRPLAVAAFATDPPSPDAPALVRGRPLLKGQPTVYVCQGFTCNLPVNDVRGLARQLDPVKR